MTSGEIYVEDPGAESWKPEPEFTFVFEHDTTYQIPKTSRLTKLYLLFMIIVSRR